jgi:hypothetical protein
MRTVTFGPLLGENNRLPDNRLSTDGGSFLRSAVNVDLTDANLLRRRKGYAKVVDGIRARSIWSNGGGVAFFADANTLYSLSSEYAKTALVSDIATNALVSYCDARGVIYATDGDRIWKLTEASATLVGIKAPQSNPALSSAAGGSLAAGTYQVAVTHIAANGEESPARFPLPSIDVAANSALTISGIPARAGFSTAVYLTPPNGDVLYRVSAAAGSSLVISLPPATDGARCATIDLDNLSGGDIIRYTGGRLLVASGSLLFYSEPFALHLYNPRKNYVQFSEAITMLEPCEGGFYLSADQTYWVGGDVASATLQAVLPYRAVANTGCRIPHNNNVWWASERGGVVGKPGGEIGNIQDKHVIVEKCSTGATMYREQDGIKQMVMSLFGGDGQQGAALSSYLDGELVRKETIL